MHCRSLLLLINSASGVTKRSGRPRVTGSLQSRHMHTWQDAQCVFLYVDRHKEVELLLIQALFSADSVAVALAHRPSWWSRCQGGKTRWHPSTFLSVSLCWCFSSVCPAWGEGWGATTHFWDTPPPRSAASPVWPRYRHTHTYANIVFTPSFCPATVVRTLQPATCHGSFRAHNHWKSGREGAWKFHCWSLDASVLTPASSNHGSTWFGWGTRWRWTMQYFNHCAAYLLYCNKAESYNLGMFVQICCERPVGLNDEQIRF